MMNIQRLHYGEGNIGTGGMEEAEGGGGGGGGVMIDESTTLSAIYTLFFLIVDAWDMVSLSTGTGTVAQQY